MRKKRFLSFVMVLTVLVGMMAGTQSALADAPTPMFDFDSPTGTITGYNGAGGDVVIPATIEGVSVTVIGEGVFLNKVNITSVTIPASVTSIGENAFLSCSNLTEAYFEGNAPNFDQSIPIS